jgi:hypothetical protein
MFLRDSVGRRSDFVSFFADTVGRKSDFVCFCADTVGGKTDDCFMFVSLKLNTKVYNIFGYCAIMIKNSALKMDGDLLMELLSVYLFCVFEYGEELIYDYKIDGN